jgi:hypothetical protein
MILHGTMSPDRWQTLFVRAFYFRRAFLMSTKKEEPMKLSLHTVSLLFVSCLLACTPLRGGQTYESPKGPCEINYKSEGSRMSASGIKTSSNVTFSNVPMVKVFGAATVALSESGYTVLSSDKETGVITAHFSPGKIVQATIAVQIKQVPEGTNLAIKISSGAVTGDIPADCCEIVGKVEDNLGVRAAGSVNVPEKANVESKASPASTVDSSKFCKAIKVCNVRPEPSTKNMPIAQLKIGETAERVGQQGDWIKVRLDDGREGWVSKGLVE